jgi:hypothetical protein
MADSTLLDQIFHSLLGRVFIAVLQTGLSSLVMLLTFFFWQDAEILLMKYILVVGIGFIAGFSARRFLKSHTQILKLLVALGSAALSLAILFTLSDGYLGINLFYPGKNTPDWGGLMQYLFAALCAWLAITAFRVPPAMVDIREPAPRVRESGPPSRPGINLRLPKTTSPAGSKIKKSTLKTAPPSQVSLAPALKPKTKSPTRLKKKRSKRKPANAKDIKFFGVVEHTCPYCLDPVEPNDPRGVKICSICKTHHHADCWGITGACQIPHFQE